MTDGGFIDLLSMMMGGVAAESVATAGYSAISYPINIPPVSGVASCTWMREEVRAVSTSPFTLQQQVFRHTGGRWRVSIVLPAMSKANALAWSAFLLSLDGQYGTFLFGDVFNPAPKGLAWGSPVVAGSANVGKVLTTRGWNANITGILKAGDKIQIGSYLYQAMRDVNSDADGEATLDIWPRLRSVPADNETIVTNNPRGLFQLASSSGELCTFSISGIATMPNFQIIEAI